MVEAAAFAARDLCASIDIDDLIAIGITGQQQGCQLLDEVGEPLGPFIAWQDQRCKDRLPDAEGTFLDALAECGGAFRRGTGLPTLPNAGCPIVTGYTAPTLFWLNYMDMMPSDASAAITGPEYLAHKLVGSVRPSTDATDAAGWGVLDVPRRIWNEDLISSLGIERSLFPEIRDSCTIIDGLDHRMSDIIGIRSGTPISIPSGDHQCAFLGAVQDATDTLAINIGTGGQASVYIDDHSVLPRDDIHATVDHGWLELRPFIQEGFLLAGVGVVGGRTFRALKDFFIRCAHEVFRVSSVDDDAVYEKLVQLAADEMSTMTGDDTIRASALFTGSRERPDARGEFANITAGNFTPGTMALAVFRSMALELANSYRTAVDLGAGSGHRIVGSGNGLRLNPVLRRCIEDEFGKTLSISSLQEEAAVGAALTAAVAVGVYPDVSDAGLALVR